MRILQGGAHPVVQTQGDANNWPDPWTAKLEGKTAWRQVVVVPHLGYAVNWLRSPTVKMVAIIIVPTLLALLMLSEIGGAGERKGRGTGQKLTGATSPRTISTEGHAS
ncbi:MAG: hypothetical protein ACRDJ3_11935 [Solirubrobacteraceae bacterium]